MEAKPHLAATAQLRLLLSVLTVATLMAHVYKANVLLRLCNVVLRALPADNGGEKNDRPTGVYLSEGKCRRMTSIACTLS